MSSLCRGGAWIKMSSGRGERGRRRGDLSSWRQDFEQCKYHSHYTQTWQHAARSLHEIRRTMHSGLCDNKVIVVHWETKEGTSCAKYLQKLLVKEARIKATLYTRLQVITLSAVIIFFFLPNVLEWRLIVLCVLFGTAHELNFPAVHIGHHLPQFQLGWVFRFVAAGFELDVLLWYHTQCGFAVSLYVSIGGGLYKLVLEEILTFKGKQIGKGKKLSAVG